MDIFSSFRLTNRILGYSRRLSLHSSTDYARTVALSLVRKLRASVSLPELLKRRCD